MSAKKRRPPIPVITPVDPSSSAAPAPAPATVFDPPFRIAVVALFLVTLLAYLPSLSGKFLWDDDGHVTKPALRSWQGLARIWAEPAATQQYYPLLHSAFWVEHRLWGDHPLGYRLLNVLLHATAACLFAAILRKLAVRGAWLAAFAFALHPVAVESVAWISEQKNTLSLVFYLAAALAYFRFNATSRWPAYLLATLLFIAALLCKTVTATLPAALLVVLWWRNGRLLWRRDFLPLSVWLALGLAAGFVTSWVEFHLIGAQGGEYTLSFLQRSLLAGRVIWFYLGKLLWPAPLLFTYPRWTVDPSAGWQYVFSVGVLFLAATLAWRGRKSRGPLAALLVFVAGLFPALGFINVYPFRFSFVADHFQYHASLPVIAAAAAGLVLLLERLPRGSAAGIAMLVVATLGSVTARRSAIFANNQVLFETTVAENPAAWMAHNNLAIILSDSGQLEAAVVHARQAVALEPGAAEAQNSLGHLLTLQGRIPEADEHLQRALALRADFPEAHNNLGIALMAERKISEAIVEFREATRLAPDFPAARFNLGLALAHAGKTGEAIEDFAQALRLKPDYADAELHWGFCLTIEGKYREAMPHFDRALVLNPRSAEAHRLYAVALGQADRIPEAIAQLRLALQLQPEFAQAHQDLSQFLRLNGRAEEADAHQREALRLQALESR